jgi:hypothetical protein
MPPSGMIMNESRFSFDMDIDSKGVTSLFEILALVKVYYLL